MSAFCELRTSCLHRSRYALLPISPLTTDHSRLHSLSPLRLPLDACRAEAAGAALRRRNLGDLYKSRLRAALHDELGDALPARDRERILAEIGEQHLHLAAVVAVDGAGAVEHGDPVTKRQSRAWAHLCLEPKRQLQDETR